MEYEWKGNGMSNKLNNYTKLSKKERCPQCKCKVEWRLKEDRNEVHKNNRDPYIEIEYSAYCKNCGTKLNPVWLMKMNIDLYYRSKCYEQFKQKIERHGKIRCPVCREEIIYNENKAHYRCMNCNFVYPIDFKYTERVAKPKKSSNKQNVCPVCGKRIKFPIKSAKYECPSCGYYSALDIILKYSTQNNQIKNSVGKR